MVVVGGYLPRRADGYRLVVASRSYKCVTAGVSCCSFLIRHKNETVSPGLKRSRYWYME